VSTRKRFTRKNARLNSEEKIKQTGMLIWIKGFYFLKEAYYVSNYVSNDKYQHILLMISLLRLLVIVLTASSGSRLCCP
jgi:hypothetical protein